MAVNGAQITLVGNCTRDPEVTYAASGTAVCKFGLAVNFRKPSKNGGDWDEEVSFFDVVAFGQFGENVGDSLTKGTRAVVVGRLQIRDWEGKDGNKGRSVEVLADEIAPSLRWATAEVQRAERSDNDGGGGGNRGGGGGGGNRDRGGDGNRGDANRGGGNRGSGGGGGNDNGGNYDEEPF